MFERPFEQSPPLFMSMKRSPAGWAASVRAAIGRAASLIPRPRLTGTRFMSLIERACVLLALSSLSFGALIAHSAQVIDVGVPGADGRNGNPPSNGGRGGDAPVTVVGSEDDNLAGAIGGEGGTG